MMSSYQQFDGIVFREWWDAVSAVEYQKCTVNGAMQISRQL